MNCYVITILFIILILIIILFSSSKNSVSKSLITDYFSYLVKSSRTNKTRDRNIATKNLSEIPIFTINLPESVKRREFMDSQAEHYGLIINYVDGVDGKKLEQNKDDNEIQKIPYKNEDISFVTNDDTATKGEIGCVLAHIKAIEAVYSKGVEVGLITEDDTSFDLIPLWDTTIREIIDNAPKDWDMIYLYYYCENQPKNKKYFSYSKYLCWSNAAYLISRGGCEKILNLLKKNNVYILDKDLTFRKQISADMLIPDICNSYCYQKKLFITNNDMDGMDSTIHEDHTMTHINTAYSSLKPYYEKIIESRSIPKVVHIFPGNKSENIIQNSDMMVKVWSSDELAEYGSKYIYEILYKHGGILGNPSIPYDSFTGMFNCDKNLSWIAVVPKHPLIRLLIINTEKSDIDFLNDVYSDMKKYLHDRDVNIVS